MDIKMQVMTGHKIPNRKISFLIHSAVWLMIFISPFLFIPSDDRDWMCFYTSYTIFQLLLMMVFYFNYFYLIGHFLFRKQTLNFILCNLLIIVAMLLAYYLLDETFLRRPFHDKGPHLRFGWLLRMSRDVIMVSLTAGLSVAIKMTVRWYETESERAELEKTRVEAELRNLKSQLNPHFLFNTLNNIYSLISIDQDRAQEAIHQLSKLLRYVLYDNNQVEVPVRMEIEFLENYMKLIRLRYPSRVDIRFDIKGDNTELVIAPLLFITLTENAFKHGIGNKEKSFVHISLDISNPKCIDFRIDNSYFPKDESDKSGSGIGLENLSRRLHLLYKDRYFFKHSRLGDVYHVCLKINY